MATEKPAAARLFQNKKTGVVWEVADPATLKRVLEDTATYEEIKGEQKKPEKLS
jgi:hypothetical protein